MARSAPLGSLRRSMRGASLLEALVSVLVLSFGVLGAVGMHTATLKANKEARNQSQALRYARELSEMMRANPSVAGVNSNTNAYLFEFEAPSTAPSVPSEACNQNCTPADLARRDVAQWQAEVAYVATAPNNGAADASGGLPGVVVKVCFDSAPYDDDGLPQWDCTNPGAGSGALPVIKMGWNRTATNAGSANSTGVDTGKDTRPMLVLPVAVNG